MAGETNQEAIDEVQETAPEQETKEENTGGQSQDAKKPKKEKKDKKAKQETELEKLTQEKESLNQENEELKNKVLRQMAEFDNFKKRTAKEKTELYNVAKADTVESFLGIIDTFERALETETADEPFKQGVEMIFKQFHETLKKLGVEEIEAQGKPFNPELHNAINQVEDENFDENTVCQVFQKGYRLGDRVIRHAMVVVANP